jgi:hypothetical protein
VITGGLAACGDASRGDGQVRVPGDSAGFATLPLPDLPPRQSPFIAGDERRVVYVGGFDLSEDGEQVVPRRDGAILDLTTTEWTTLPLIPFREAPYRVGGVLSSDGLTIVGTPCASASSDNDLADCGGDNNAQAATFDFDVADWTVHAPPPAVEAIEGAPAPMTANGIGMSARGPIFSLRRQAAERLVVLDLDSAEWIDVPAPADGAFRYCTVDGRTFAFRTNLFQGTGSGVPPISATWFLEDGELTWRALPEADVELAPAMELLTCDPTAISVMAAQMDEPRLTIRFFDPVTMTWSDPLALPLEQSGAATAAQFAGGTVIWPSAWGGDSSFFFLDQSGLRSFEKPTPPEIDHVALLSTTPEGLVVAVPPEDGQEFGIGLLAEEYLQGGAPVPMPSAPEAPRP